MIDLKITKQRVATHLHYSLWLYATLITAAVVLFAAVYLITRPVVPKELKIDINVLDSKIDERGKLLWEKEILEALTDNQREVNISAIGLNAEDDLDGYQMSELIVARTNAQQDDIYILSKSLFDVLAPQGAFLPLDDMKNKYVYAEGVDIESYELILSEGIGEDDQRHLYGLPLDNVAALSELGIDPKDKVAVILVYTKNEANAKIAVDFIMTKKGT